MKSAAFVAMIAMLSSAAHAAGSAAYMHVELSPRVYGATPGETAGRVASWISATGAVLDRRVHPSDGVQDNRELGWAVLTVDKIEGTGNFVGEMVFLMNTEGVLKDLGKVTKKKAKLDGKTAYDVIFKTGMYASQLEAVKKKLMPQVRATWIFPGAGMAKFGPWLALEARTDCAKLKAADKAGLIVECKPEVETLLYRE